MTPAYIFDEMRRAERGLAPHYAFIYAATVGVEARRVHEFGAGMSTRVMLDALDEVGGDSVLVSLSTDDPRYVAERCGMAAPHPRWLHYTGLSREITPTLPALPLDMVLHDGAHDEETVAADLAWALPLLRRYGLALVHDTLHESCGAAVRRGVARALALAGGPFSRLTLPFGYGLTILRCENPERPPIEIRRKKAGSAFTTVLEP